MEAKFDGADYPAAHSADSTWFAVDADGHVGVFETGPEGMMPNSIEGDAQGFFGRSLVEMVATERDDGVFVIRHPAPELTPGEGLEVLRQWKDAWASFIILCREGTIPSAVIAELSVDEDEGAIVQFDGSLIFAVLSCEVKFLRRAVESGTITGLKLFQFGEQLRPLLGFYPYAAAEDYGGEDNPYLRQGAPLHPMTREELTDYGREVVQEVEFQNLRFSERESIIPAEHVPCSGWGSTFWVDGNGELHPHEPVKNSIEEVRAGIVRNNGITTAIAPYYDLLCALGHDPLRDMPNAESLRERVEGKGIDMNAARMDEIVADIRARTSPQAPAPRPYQPSTEPGLLQRFLRWLFGKPGA
ncbi:hypothetical protein [Methylovirgula sp. 4M-Z18]|uniref:hypothetical protein n=1 Tax=Methylovirgula sp. 4M-Z18 TaxID=2293567 RepID=UPI000E2FE973|nr:hypothetical protein [Methylovirgula sp. 4M-Z18]RFB78879.1 hypothetical protein DYH55_13665 [Methylovirgula sp. 4M-Z18]